MVREHMIWCDAHKHALHLFDFILYDVKTIARKQVTKDENYMWLVQ